MLNRSKNNMKFFRSIFLILLPLSFLAQNELETDFQYDVGSPQQLGFNYQLTHVQNGSDASICMFPSGTATYEYKWLNQNDNVISTNSNIGNLSEGVYKLFIKKTYFDLVTAGDKTDSALTYFWVGKYGASTTLYFQPDANFGDDAMVIRHTNPSLNGQNTNYGINTNLWSAAGTNSGYPNASRFLIRFQYTGLENAIIDSANFDLFGWYHRNQTLNGSGIGNECYIRMVDVGTQNEWKENTVTWNSNTFALHANELTIPRKGVNGSGPVEVQFIQNINIASLIQPQINGSIDNNGVMVGLFDENIYRSQLFYSSDYTDPNKRPKLTVTFTVPSESITASCIAPPVELVCESCIGSFAPKDSAKYLISAWASDEDATPNDITLTDPKLSIVCQTGSGAITIGPFSPSGQIIDGWQRIEEEFIIPQGTTNIQVLLESNSGNVYFDDIRFFPFDASMKTYVYDPINMRLAAELDERHYATFYEYDEEGKKIRIKKETEKGVMTIQETKSNSAK